jgi:hypothetical protein
VRRSFPALSSGGNVIFFDIGAGVILGRKSGSGPSPLHQASSSPSLSSMAESLLAAETAFGGLNRCVSEQELNLVKFSAR